MSEQNGMNGWNADQLHAYHDGELSGFARWRFEQRLRRSPALRGELEALRALSTEFQGLADEGSEPDLWDAVALRLPAIDAERRDARAPARVGWGLSWLRSPIGAAAVTVLLVVAVAVGWFWPETARPVPVVRWIDSGGRSVMVLDDVPGTTIIWVLDSRTEGASTGDGREVV